LKTNMAFHVFALSGRGCAFSLRRDDIEAFFCRFLHCYLF
jgi:hypothetical protein